MNLQDQYHEALDALLAIPGNVSRDVARGTHRRQKAEQKGSEDLSVAQSATQQADESLAAAFAASRSALKSIGYESLLPAKVRPSAVENATFDELARALVDVNTASSSVDRAVHAIETARKRDSQLLRESKAQQVVKPSQPAPTSPVIATESRKKWSPIRWTIVLASLAAIVVIATRLFS